MKRLNIVNLILAQDRHAYLHVAMGTVKVAGMTLTAGDALMFSN